MWSWYRIMVKSKCCFLPPCYFAIYKELFPQVVYFSKICYPHHYITVLSCCKGSQMSIPPRKFVRPHVITDCSKLKRTILPWTPVAKLPYQISSKSDSLKLIRVYLVHIVQRTRNNGNLDKRYLISCIIFECSHELW